MGNMIAQAMWLRLGVQTDFSLTNTTGIRADVDKFTNEISGADDLKK